MCSRGFAGIKAVRALSHEVKTSLAVRFEHEAVVGG